MAKPKPVVTELKVKETGPTAEDLEQIRARNSDFLYKRLKTLSRVVFVQSLSVALLLVLFIGYALMRPNMLYFGITPDLRTIALTPLTEPTMTATGVAQWTQRTISESLSLTFDNYKQTLVDARPNFSESAYNTLIASLNKNGDLEKLGDRDRHFSMTAAPTDNARVVKDGVIGGRRIWRVEIPVLVTRRSITNPRGVSDQLLAVAAVERVSELENPSGVRVAQVVFERK